MSGTTIIRQDGEGERLWFAGGGLWTMKASAAETGGAFLLFEDDVVRGKTTPLHVHPHEDELVYVLEGELLVHSAGEEHRVGERGFFLAPRGVPHAFLVTSETARLLAFQTPGTGESFYRGVSEPATSDEDATRPPDFARLRAAAEQTDRLEILGPPPFGDHAVAESAVQH
ncbi:MAG TPA: cupin domain-containing protein [Solirubrobacteraceae bacterium]|nr:cupin domain-containing protein [Solirubrobacteraceae bacterium]